MRCSMPADGDQHGPGNLKLERVPARLFHPRRATRQTTQAQGGEGSSRWKSGELVGGNSRDGPARSVARRPRGPRTGTRWPRRQCTIILLA
jgi:hypothetical protein